MGLDSFRCIECGDFLGRGVVVSLYSPQSTNKIGATMPEPEISRRRLFGFLGAGTAAVAARAHC